jgi:hypothetical protein
MTQLVRTNKKRKLSEKVNESAKRAKIEFAVDDSLTLDVCVSEKTYTITSDLLICVLSFLPTRFTPQANKSNSRASFNHQYSVMGLRLVNKMFCFAYHRTAELWKMPDTLALTPFGIQSMTEYHRDYLWPKKLFLYKLYQTQDDDEEKEAMLKRMTTYKTLYAENESIGSRASTLFRRAIKMAEAISVPIPPELFNSKCTLKIHSLTQQSVVDEWLALREKGNSILNLTRFTFGLEEDVFNLQPPGARHMYIGPTNKILQYEKIDIKEFLRLMAADIHELNFVPSQDEMFRTIGNDIVFPNVVSLKVFGKLNLNNQLKTAFPNLKTKQYRLTQKGEEQLRQGPSAAVKLWNKITNSGILKDELLAENDEEQKKMYFQLMNTNYIFLREMMPNQFTVFRREVGKGKQVRDIHHENLRKVSKSKKGMPHQMSKNAIKKLMRQKLVYAKKISIYE